MARNASQTRRSDEAHLYLPTAPAGLAAPRQRTGKTAEGAASEAIGPTAHPSKMDRIVSCNICGVAQIMEELRPGAVAQCCRCGSTLAKARVNSLSRTAAFSLAALIFYVPANIYPILRMEYYGAYTENTVWDGCVRLFQDGQWLVAIIVFLASSLIPLFKL